MHFCEFNMFCIVVSLCAAVSIRADVPHVFRDDDFTPASYTTQDVIESAARKTWNVSKDGSYFHFNANGVSTLIVYLGLNVCVKNISMYGLNNDLFSVSCSTDRHGSSWYTFVPNNNKNVEIDLNWRCPYLKLACDFNLNTMLTLKVETSNENLLKTSVVKAAPKNKLWLTDKVVFQFPSEPIFKGVTLIESQKQLQYYGPVLIIDEHGVMIILTEPHENGFIVNETYIAPASRSFRMSRLYVVIPHEYTALLTIYVTYPTSKEVGRGYCTDTATIESFTSSPIKEDLLYYGLYRNYIVFEPFVVQPQVIVKFASIHFLTGVKIKWMITDAFNISFFVSDGYGSRIFHDVAEQVTVAEPVVQVWFEDPQLGLYVKAQLPSLQKIQLQFYGCKLDDTYALGLQNFTLATKHFDLTLSSGSDIGIFRPPWNPSVDDWVVMEFPYIYRFSAMASVAKSPMKFQISLQYSLSSQEFQYGMIKVLPGTRTLLFLPKLFARKLKFVSQEVQDDQEFSMELYGSAKDYSQAFESFDDTQKHTAVTVDSDVISFQLTKSDDEKFILFSFKSFCLVTGIVNFRFSEKFLPSFIFKYSDGNDIFHLYNPQRKKLSIFADKVSGLDTDVQVYEVEPTIGKEFRFYPLTSYNDLQLNVSLLVESLMGRDIVPDLMVPSHISAEDENVTVLLTMHNTKAFSSYDVIFRGLSDDGGIGLSYKEHTLKSDTDFVQPFVLNTDQEGMRNLSPLQLYMGLDQPESTHLKMSLSIPNNSEIQNFSLETVFSHYNISRFTLYTTKQTSVNIMWTDQRPVVTTGADEVVEENLSIGAEIINPFLDEVPVGNSIFLSVNIHLTPYQDTKCFIVKIKIMQPGKNFIVVYAKSKTMVTTSQYLSVIGKKDGWYCAHTLYTNDATPIEPFASEKKMLMKVVNDLKGSPYLISIITYNMQVIGVLKTDIVLKELNSSSGADIDISFILTKHPDGISIETEAIPYKRKSVNLCWRIVKFYGSCRIVFVKPFQPRGMLTSDMTLLVHDRYVFVCLNNCPGDSYRKRSPCVYIQLLTTSFQWKVLNPNFGAVKSYEYQSERIFGVSSDGKRYLKMSMVTGNLQELNSEDEFSGSGELLSDVTFSPRVVANDTYEIEYKNQKIIVVDREQGIEQVLSVEGCTNVC